MLNRELVVALTRPADCFSTHLQSAGIHALRDLTSIPEIQSVDVICHDASVSESIESSLSSLVKAHPSASLLVLVAKGQSLHLESVPGNQFINTITQEQLEAGELSDILSSPSLTRRTRENASRRKILTSLQTVTVRDNGAHERQNIIRRSLAEIMVLTSADFAAFYRKETQDGELNSLMSLGNTLAWPLDQPYTSSSLIDAAYHSEEMQKTDYILDSLSTVENLRPVVQECAIPLLVEDRVLGVIQIAFENHNRRFDQACEDLQQFADVASVVIENETLLIQAKGELERTKALSELGTYLHVTSGLELINSRVSEWLIDNLQADSAGIILLSADQSVLGQTKYISSATGPEPAEFTEIELIDQTLYQWSMDRAETVIVSRGEFDPRETDMIHKLRAQQGLGALICIPLEDKNGVSGLLVVQKDKHAKNFSETEISVLNTVCSQLSIAIHREALLKEIAHKAYHDPLTQLPNRYLFEKRFEDALQRAKERHRKLGLILLDIDQFKSINETRGHAVGDMLLVMLAERLRDQLRPTDEVARIGGDEFAILLQNVSGVENTISLAERLVASIAEPFEIDEMRHRLGAKVGLSLFPQHGDCREDLIKNGGVAKHYAKSNRRNVVTVYDQKLADSYQRHINISGEMQEALDCGQFELHYQPQVCMRTGRVNAVEALIRWNHPESGLVSPAEFVPIAEKSGLITKIGTWVVDTACRQMSAWQAQGLSGLKVAVNIASQQFEMDEFVQDILDATDRHNLDPSALELEVTESVVMTDIDAVAEKLMCLREANIMLAIDDFGTGYSSLSYLQDLPLDILKIDRSFVKRLESSNNTVAHSIAALAQSLGLLTVAEGVETECQLAKVRELKVDFVQGYYFSKPLPAADVPKVIEELAWQDKDVRVTQQ